MGIHHGPEARVERPKSRWRQLRLNWRSSASRALASFRLAVSNPSVNQL